MKKNLSGDEYLPPTFLDNMKYQLEKKGRTNINDRDRRLLQYIRCLQESKRRNFFRPWTRMSP